MKITKILIALIVVSCFMISGCGSNYFDLPFQGRYKHETFSTKELLEVDANGYFIMDSYENGYHYAKMEGRISDAGFYTNATIRYNNGTIVYHLSGSFILDRHDNLTVKIFDKSGLISETLFIRTSYSSLNSPENETKAESVDENGTAALKIFEKVAVSE